MMVGKPAARGISDVFVAALPLTASKGPPQLLMSTAYSLSVSWDLQHFIVLSTSTHLPSQVTLINNLNSSLNFNLLLYQIISFLLFPSCFLNF